MSQPYPVPVRWRDDVGWELKCNDCASRQVACYWPLDDEFWDKRRGLQRCRGCFKTNDAARAKRLYWASTTHRERRRESSRKYHQANRAAEKIRARIRWEETKADPEKHARAIETSRASSKRYREKQAA